MEAGESLVQSVIREVWEETGLMIDYPKLVGIQQGQTEANERYLVFLYKATQFTGQLTSSEEGEVMWVSKEQLATMDLLFDLEDVLKVMEDEYLSEFYYLPLSEPVDGRWLRELY